MSVINNVLKGLENRESLFTPIEITTLESVPAAKPDRRPGLFAAVGLLLIALAAGAYYLLQRIDTSVAQSGQAAENFTRAPIVKVPASTDVIEANTRVPVATPAEAVAGNQIVGLQIRESETEMRLEFALRGRVVAYLKERGKNDFSYHLRDVESQIVAPLMRDNRWIRELVIRQSAAGVDVNFATAPEILVETRQEVGDDESIWVIKLRQEKPALLALTTAPAAVPTAPEMAVVPAAPAKVVAPAAAPTVAAPPAAALDAPASAAVKLTIKSSNPLATTTNQLDYAVELMNSGRLEDAEKLLRELLGGSHDYSARKHLLVLYDRMKRPARMQSLLEASLQTYPQDPLLQTEYARLLFQSAAYARVIALLVSNSTLSADQHALIAASYQRLDQHQEAMLYYEQALLQDPQNARNWVGLGISQEYSSRHGEALASYQRAGRLGSLNERLRAFAAERSARLQQVVN